MNYFSSNPLIFFSPGAGGRGGKREFDRKSGDTRTGIKAEEKRGGSGKGNWGNFEDDVKVGVSDDLFPVTMMIIFVVISMIYTMA